MAGPEQRGDVRVGTTANVLGALALALTDRTSEACTEAARHSDSAAAALAALHHFLGAPPIDLLRQVLGLTSSGTVRLVDRLEDDGFVRRRPGTDGRSTMVSLTVSGRRAAARVAAARATVLNEAVEVLSASERELLDGLLSRVLVGMIRGPGATRWICRLCDTEACGREIGKCPIARETRARYGPE